MIETANRISDHKVSPKLLNKIIGLGHELLEKPVELLDGVQETLDKLEGGFNIILATKGDLLDQERKLRKSGLESYFNHIHIMSDKSVRNYQNLLKQLNCKPENFLMLGNSIKSDILPVLELGGYAAHIPYDITWIHERHEDLPAHSNFIALKNIDNILNYLAED